MKQAIVILVKNKSLEKILKKYHPTHKKFKPHITLVYTFSVKNQKYLEKHITESIKNIKKFKSLLKGLKKSAKEYYLYLLINKNKSKIVKLYKKLNSGILSGFENPKLPKYIPHISLGFFKNEHEINQVIIELEKEKIKIPFEIEKISLLTLKKDSSIKKIKYFYLR